MTSHPEAHITTDYKPDMLSGVQTGNRIPHDRYNIRSNAHEHTNRKNNIFMQRRLAQSFTYILELGQGTCTLTKHTRRWTYSAMRHFFTFLQIITGGLLFMFFEQWWIHFDNNKHIPEKIMSFYTSLKRILISNSIVSLISQVQPQIISICQTQS